MGVIYSRLTRPIRTFNIENRADRIISREKPIPAPQHVSAERQKKLADKVYPEFLEKHHQKNMQLDQRLKDVFVTSTDSQNIIQKTKSKFLPQNRYSENEFYIDFYEPTIIPKGKCTLRQALVFICQHKTDPIKYSSENIAVEYKIDKKVIDDILKHFKTYMTIVPNIPDKPVPDPFQKIVDHLYEEYKKTKKLDKD